MKTLITLMILITVAFVLKQKQELVVLPGSSTMIHTNQKLILNNGSFSPLYMHVFEQDKSGPVENLNLTDEMKNSVMTIKSFKKFVHQQKSTWFAYLSREEDSKIYVCELEEALKTNEIALINE